MKKKLFLSNVLILMSLFACSSGNSSSAKSSLETSNKETSNQTLTSSGTSSLSSDTFSSVESVTSSLSSSSSESVTSSSDVSSLSSQETSSSSSSTSESHEFDAIKGKLNSGFKCFYKGNYKAKITSDGVFSISNSEVLPSQAVDFYNDVGTLIKDASNENHYTIETTYGDVNKTHHLYHDGNGLFVYFQEGDADKTAVFKNSDAGLLMQSDDITKSFSILIKDYSDNNQSSSTSIGEYINFTLTSQETYKIYVDYANNRVDFAPSISQDLALNNIVDLSLSQDSYKLKITQLGSYNDGYRYKGEKISLDGFEGTYVGEEGNMVLDGINTVTFNNKTSTYTLNKEESSITFEGNTYILNVQDKTYEKKEVIPTPQGNIFANYTFTGKYYDDWDEMYNNLTMKFDAGEQIKGTMDIAIPYHFAFTGEFDNSTYTLTLSFTEAPSKDYVGKIVRLSLSGKSLTFLNDFNTNVYTFEGATIICDSFVTIN